MGRVGLDTLIATSVGTPRLPRQTRHSLECVSCRVGGGCLTTSLNKTPTCRALSGAEWQKSAGFAVRDKGRYPEYGARGGVPHPCLYPTRNKRANRRICAIPAPRPSPGRCTQASLPWVTCRLAALPPARQGVRKRMQARGSKRGTDRVAAGRQAQRAEPEHAAQGDEGRAAVLHGRRGRPAANRHQRARQGVRSFCRIRKKLSRDGWV
jgi:hypothetical protein